MEHLWAPWRNAYVTSNDIKSKETLFHDLGQSTNDEENFVFFRSKSVYAILNRFPYNASHSLVVPYRSVSDLRDLSQSELQDLWNTVNQVTTLIEKAFNPHGFNVGINIGASSGAGIPHHLHVHVVPRWKDDANFMTATAEVRVHPSELKEIYQKLTAIRDSQEPSP
ncbi:MAG: HIT domain-containing protein [Verrucomicrobiota bacterium]